ncbi:MAG: TlpA family protein disulfide reductase [Acidobacteriia bacterium]|nr:TlpA family protein disulfide reductase [Terriglobia bacterium]
MAHRSFLSLLFLAALPIWAQPCDAPSNVKAAIEAATLPGKPMDDRIAAAKEVRDRFPSDYFAHRFYQELFVNQQGLFSQPVREEYHALLNANPDDLMYLMLYARTLKGTNTPEAIKLLDRILERQPDHAMARLKLVEIYSAPAFRDAQKLLTNLVEYRKACPDALEGYFPQYINPIGDPEFISQSAVSLRKLLEGRTDEQALRSYNTLWSLEFKSTPLSAQEPVRERIRQDVVRLRAADWAKIGSLLTELRDAYKMLGDAEGSKWVDEHMAKSGSPHPSGAAEAINEWRRTHPYKTGSEREAFQETLLKQTEEWIREWPDDPQPRNERFMAMQMMQDAPLEDTVKAAEDWIRVYEAHPGAASPYASPYLTVAGFYSRHNMRYGELPDLLEKGVKQLPALESPKEAAPVSDLYLVNSQARRTPPPYAWSQLNSAAGIYLKIKKYDKAHELLAKLGPSLMKEKPADSAPEFEKRQFEQTEYMYWNNMARWARAEGHRLEALTYERNAMLADPNTRMNASMEQYRTSSLRELWKEINGSEEGFEAWMAKTGAASPHPVPAAAPKAPAPIVASTQMGWAPMDKPLPDFQISDAEGKTWRLADLKGKVALVNLWATWCGPCRNELPYLQKLFNKVRERKDLVVITLNTDDNPGLILPFLAENKYTFPVLPASAYVAKLVPELSIPRNWIVDAGGVLKMERIGFGSGDDQWVDEMVGVMEKARPK